MKATTSGTAATTCTAFRPRRCANGDFSEERAINPNFHLYDPATGNADGTGRTEFPGGIIPADRITSLAKQIQALYPAPNNPGTNSGLQNNLYIPRDPKADRDNYDFKMDWNRTNNHRIFVKFSTLRAKVSDIFKLGYDPVGFGDTKIYVPTAGHTWTISPTMVLDGTVGMNKQDQFAKGGDFGTNFGSDTFEHSRDQRSGSPAERHANLQSRLQHDWQ